MLSENEKDELLAPLPEEKIIDGRDLLRALLIFLCFFILFAPKIYFSSEIYYLSRDVTKIKNRLDLLKEENRMLKKNLEDFKFQQVLRMD
ncbi:hypothetical protein CQA62_02100 [Helicobacter cholecystus]|uniref:Septum formation initiator n=1 Tax=Helicobacter cholecystus TaxID=45498 RepID=A0A3D8IWP5_9HELI|nr:hypothetical protein [Helicobacter cholecystus]RDU69463.1 hypothetical protein CQA62_02100 [Helicobacter cholecystus]VEJ24014.1 Uncharacterised protein [Helicobacter cholecystus]